MSDNIFFTIVIPTYNRAKFIAKTIQTAMDQTFKSFEILVVDDGSTDNTEEIVRSLNCVNLTYYKKKNEERSIARNYGISRAKGKYVTFLDSDDLLHPQYLQYAHETLEKNNFPPFLNCSYEICNYKGKIIERRILKKPDIKILVKGNAFSCIGNFVRSDVSKEYMFNEDPEMITSEDWELWIRIAAKHGYVVDPRIGSCIVDHSTRSVRNFDIDKLIKHKYVALRHAMMDPNVVHHFSKYSNQMRASTDTYISLHVALTGRKWLAIKYLFMGFIKYPPCILNRRFLAINKHLLITW